MSGGILDFVLEAGGGRPDITTWLSQLRGGLKTSSLNARTVTAQVTNHACNARQAMNAARINTATVASILKVPGEPGQSPFALGRGNQFERRVKRDEYLALIDLLRTRGLDPSNTDVLDIRSAVPIRRGHEDEDLAVRAARTRDAVLRIARGEQDSELVVDGGALVWTIGGFTVRLETDALAWWIAGKLRVVEIKSFPVEWGQIPADKVSAMAWQTAVYVAAVQDLLRDAGEDADLVSTEIFLVCPRNTTLTPDVIAHNVAPQLRLLRRFQHQAPQLDELANRAGDVTLDVTELPESDRPAALAAALARLEPRYQPNCLSTCDLATHCRSVAQAAGNPACLGSEVIQALGVVGNLRRGAELMSGADAASDDEADFADLVDTQRSLESWIARSRL